MTATGRPPRYGILLFTLSLVTTITSIVSSLGAPLVPKISTEFDIEITQAQWTLTATLLTAAIATPVLGRLGGGAWRRPTILVGLLIVAVGCVLSALPLGFVALVIGRTLQGVGMALVPLAMAVARESFAVSRLAPAIAILSVAGVAGAGLGYPITATVASVWGLHTAYWLGATLSLITLILAVRYIPPSRASTRMSVDWIGALLLSSGTGTFLLAVSHGEPWGWLSPRTLGLAAAGIIAFALWIVWSLRCDQPLVDLRLAVRPGVAAPNLVAAGGGIAMYTLLSLVIVLVQNPDWGLDQSLAVAGLMLTPYSLTSVIGSRMALVAVKRFGPDLVLPFGCTIFMCSTLGLAVAHDHVAWAVVWMAVGGLGGGFSFSSLAVLIIPHIPSEETGSAMAFNLVLRYLGFTVGSAVSVALMAVYGGGNRGFVLTLITASVVFVAVGIGAWLLSKRVPQVD
ncbi:MFS transporter [Williamsia sp.]|uniref:MFS transporter n=1 Tax=Williamsia sp. TaxID=1872085 RepID=UPI002F952970